MYHLITTLGKGEGPIARRVLRRWGVKGSNIAIVRQKLLVWAPKASQGYIKSIDDSLQKELAEVRELAPLPQIRAKKKGEGSIVVGGKEYWVDYGNLAKFGIVIASIVFSALYLLWTYL